MQLSFKAPCAELVMLENIWLQLSNVACNLKCKHCFLDCHPDNRKRNFLDTEKIIQALKSAKSLKMIYLTGGEPFLHPKINEILRYCLKKADVTIFSNGTLINEKKIKVLKEIENISPNRLFFKLSLDHYAEGRNDEYRGTSVFKKVINALVLAQKYDIRASITCVNLKNENEEALIKGFEELFNSRGINLDKNAVKIVPMLKMGNYAKYYNITDRVRNVEFKDIENFDMDILDCKNSRVITSQGVYSCPALVNDPRGYLGNTLENSGKNVYLETQTCYDCVSRREKLFG